MDYLVANPLTSVDTLIIQVDNADVVDIGPVVDTVSFKPQPIATEDKPNILVDWPRINPRTIRDVQEYIVLVEDGYNEEEDLELEDDQIIEDDDDDDEEDVEAEKRFRMKDLKDVEQFLKKNNQVLTQVII